MKSEEDPWMIRHNHPYKIKWDLIVMFLATWNTVAIPIEVSFQPKVLEHNFFRYVDVVIDFLFFCDILINFRYAYINTKTGEEVRKGLPVAWNYIKTRFFIDLLATIPFDTLAGLFFNSDSIYLQLFGLMKLVRVLRLSRIISFLNFQDDVKVTLKLGKVIFFLSIYLHCLACLWFYIVSYDKDWIPPLDYQKGYTDIYEEDWEI